MLNSSNHCQLQDFEIVSLGQYFDIAEEGVLKGSEELEAHQESKHK
jgi:hypothetical protein